MHHVGSLVHALHKVSDGLICLSYQQKSWRKFRSQCSPWRWVGDTPGLGGGILQWAEGLYSEAVAEHLWSTGKPGRMTMAPCKALISSFLQARRLLLSCWQGAGSGEFMALAVSMRRHRWKEGLRDRLEAFAQRMQNPLSSAWVRAPQALWPLW